MTLYKHKNFIDVAFEKIRFIDINDNHEIWYVRFWNINLKDPIPLITEEIKIPIHTLKDYSTIEI